MIDLKGKPFYLDADSCRWVEETLNSMTVTEKIGQVFCPVGQSPDPEVLKAMLDKYQPGGMMYRAGVGAEIQEAHRTLQNYSKIPLLLSANLESGGNGIAVDGTYYAKQMQVAATDDETMAYRLGQICGREGGAVGCNWAFSPIIDIDMNFRNPITNVRTYGSDADRVKRMASAYMDAIEKEGISVCIKHFPGDGVDERDQHLVASVNSLSCEVWDQTYGMVYKHMIDKGARTLMAGHMIMPAYIRHFNPEIADKDMLPATLSKELLTDLLRGKLGYNGMITTDATAMVPFNQFMSRSEAIVASLMAGCDMILFNKNIDEDYQAVRNGLESGALTMERLEEAITRILAVKASLGLHKKKSDGCLVPQPEALSVLKCEQHEQWARECADKAVTLVKDNQKLLPVTPERYKKVRLYVMGENSDGGFGDNAVVGKLFEEKLKAAGFEVEVFDKEHLNFGEVFGAGVDYIRQQFDLAIYLANVQNASNQTTTRLDYVHLMAADAPWYLKDVPAMFISVSNPYHLLDIPMIPTFINAYTSNEYVLDAVIEKIMGRSEFKGISPVDPFCGAWCADQY